MVYLYTYVNNICTIIRYKFIVGCVVCILYTVENRRKLILTKQKSFIQNTQKISSLMYNIYKIIMFNVHFVHIECEIMYNFTLTFLYMQIKSIL